MGAGKFVDRRAWLGGMVAVLAPLPALAFLGPQKSLDPALLPGLRFRAIVVDAGPMAAKGGRAFVDLMRRVTLPALNKAFADRLAPGDPRGLTLRVVLDSASFAQDIGGYDELTTPTDYLEGTGLVTGPRGEVLASYPLSAQMPNPAMNRLDQVNGNELRARLLAEAFAQWLRRGIGV